MKRTPPAPVEDDTPSSEWRGVVLHGEKQPPTDREVEKFLAILAGIIARVQQEGRSDEKSSGIHPREQ